MSISRGYRTPLAIAFVVSATVVAFDCIATESQRHFILLSGWMLLICLVLSCALAKRSVCSPATTPESRIGLRLSLSVVTATLSLIHINYSTPDSAFEVLLFVLLTATVVTGFLLVSRSVDLISAEKKQEKDSLVAYWQQRYGDLLQVHFGILLATIPVTVLHGLLSHGHGALSTLISKGTS